MEEIKPMNKEEKKIKKIWKDGMGGWRTDYKNSMGETLYRDATPKEIVEWNELATKTKQRFN